MTDPRTLSIKDFTYLLPDERIANYPLPERDASKLLIYKGKTIKEDIYRNIADHIPAESLLVFNDTRVIEARLLFQKSTGGVVEIFCLEPHEQYADVTTAMMQQKTVLWKCLIGGASKWKHGQILEKKIIQDENEIILKARFIEKSETSFTVELSWNEPSLSFAEILHLAGVIPLPPYIKRGAEPDDAERYQTIYANQDGSVAAPTAGLHFTEGVFKSLEAKNVQKEFVTLHVGAGTFMPVKSETMQNHEMHAEYFTVTRSTIEKLINNADQKIIAVGTTSLRTIESLYWLGVKQSTVNSQQSMEITQWEVYESEQNISATDALTSLLKLMQKNNVDQITAKTQIIIAPGYKFRIVKGLVTNFHQPQSTLLLLVAAFIGDEWKKTYEYALQNDFRFLSYGDGNLLWLDQE
jgi:S-adenosylmethionine:tRNA ribosyltransferase-isomerase